MSLKIEADCSEVIASLERIRDLVKEIRKEIDGLNSMEIRPMSTWNPNWLKPNTRRDINYETK